MKIHPEFKIREIIDLLIEFVYLAIIFCVPLYFSIWFPTYNVFELAKLFIFKSLVWLLLFLSTAKFIFYCPKNCLRLRKYLIVPVIFILGLGCGLLFSGNIAQSFFGSYDRQAGYLSILFYFIWFVLLVFNIRMVNNHRVKGATREETGYQENSHEESGHEEKSVDILERNINRIFVTIALSGLLVAIYGILQILGIDFLTWPEDPLFTQRTFSTFGQPNFLASWLLMIIPLSAYLLYKNKKFILRFFYFLTLIIQLICLFFTSSRGGIVAFCLMILLVFVYLLFFIKLKKASKILAGGGLLFIIIFSLWGLNLIIPGRVVSLLDLRDGSSAMRLDFYSAAADAIAKKPLFGYGLENSDAVFITYYRPDWGIYSNVSASTDRAHNLILDILLTTGFFGLIFYIALYYYFFRLASRNLVEKKMRLASAALSLGAAAYLFSLLFSFSIVSGEIYFWLYLALIVAISSNSSEELLTIKSQKLKVFLEQIKIILFILLAGLAVWGINYEFRVIEADHYFNSFYYTLAEKQYFTAFTLFSYLEGEKTNPVNSEYYNRFAGDKLSDFYPEMNDLLTKKLTLFKLTKLAKALPSGYYQNNLVRAKIDVIFGNYAEAEKYFQEVISETPYWPKTYIDFGPLLVKEKKITEAIINYQLLLKILPDINDTRLNDQHKFVLQAYRKVIFISLGDIYFSLNNYSEAEKYYQDAYLSDIHDYTIFKKIADTYYLRGNFSKAIEYNLRGAARNPADYNWPLAVASLYKQQGNKLAAVLYFKQALELAPTDSNLLKIKADYIN
jgi:putative inorganic carbon (HCO3(-)) transporter